MGVYIKGMVMPETCRECALNPACESCEGYHSVCPVLEEPIAYDGRLPGCPLVEVLEPHGDLVDRKEVARISVDLANGRTYFTSKNLAIALTEATVIEMEE